MPIQSSLKSILGDLQLCTCDVSELRKLLGCHIEDILSLYSRNGTCDADPDSLSPNSPESEKLELMVWAPSIKTCLLRTLRWILPNLRPFPSISSARRRGRE